MATLLRETPPANTTINNITINSNEHNQEQQLANGGLTEEDLASGVPAPFPILRQANRTDGVKENNQKSIDERVVGDNAANDDALAIEEKRVDAVEQQPSVLPSISLVESSALITLNTLLSASHPSKTWTPIVPQRRHSTPVFQSSSSTAADTESDSSLQILLDNVRTLGGDEMTQLGQSSTIGQGKNALLHELKERVNSIATTMDEHDAQLARSLVSLLAHSYRLTQLQPDSLTVPTQVSENNIPPWESSNIYDTLDRQVSDLKARREEENATDNLDEGARNRVERALLWNRIDEDLEIVSRLCRQRIGGVDPFADEHEETKTIRDRAISPSLPPEYDPADFELPEYQYRTSYDYPPSFSEKEKEKRRMTMDDNASVLNGNGSTVQDEKMRLDLEAITLAIDRLYLVAPQLHNQRVELRAKKREEMERAARAATSSHTNTANSSRNKSSTPNGIRSRSGSGVMSGEEKMGMKGKGKQREDDLEAMLGLIGKASSRRLNDQAVVVSDELREKMRKARMADDENRRKFIHQLATHSNAGRLHNQDALLPNPQTKLRDSEVRDPETLLTLPEFIKEAVPRDIQKEQERERLEDPHAMLTLPEFVKESLILHNPSSSNTHSPSVSRRGSEKYLTVGGGGGGAESEGERRDVGSEGEGKTLRKRASVSGRLRSKSVSSASAAGAWLMGKSWSRQSVAAIPPSPSPNSMAGLQTTASSHVGNTNAGLEISFVAEYQDNLNVVVLLFKITNPPTSGNGNGSSPLIPDQLVVEVVPSPVSASEQGLSYGDRLLIKHGASWSPPLLLPTRVSLGKFTVAPTGEHYEVKLSTPTSSSEMAGGRTVLLDAAELTNFQPSSLVCASCSLPLVHTASPSRSNTPANQSLDPFNPPRASTSSNDLLHTHDSSEKDRLVYRDLPSEYWTELVDAWMCHHDQALNEKVAKNAREGFWPANGECLVGGSYLLVDEGAVVGSNLKIWDGGKEVDDWKHVRCICGALVGRCQQSPVTKTMTYRLPKYSIRPVAANARPIRIPMSAYVVEDMIEISQAHATYRFVVCDEEEEKPRLLLWLFKPNMRLSYSTPTSTLIPRSGSVTAAKILFKIIGPGGTLAYDMKTTLEKHPNFAHAEHLYYPIDICRRLAGLLRESHSTYPSNRRTMSGLDAGWLQRST